MPAVKKKPISTKTFNKSILPGSLLLFSIALTLVAWQISQRNLKEKTNYRFQYAVGNIQSKISARMTAYEQVLRSAVGFFYSSDTVTRSDWREYVQALRLQKAYPGIEALGYTRRLFPHEVEPFTRTVSSEGYAGFRVWPIDPRSEYHSIVYLEPFAGRNLRAFGYDMFTEQKRREAMQRAMHSGEPALSRMVQLVQETGENRQKGCLLYLSVYNRRMKLNSAEQKNAALRGFVYGAFRINDLMKGILDSAAPQVDFAVYDGPVAGSASLFYASPNFRLQNHQAAASSSRSILVAGHEWTLVFKASPYFAAANESDLPNVIAVAGVLVNLLLLFILVKINLLSGRNRVLAEQYKAEKDRYEIVSLSTHDIIWEWDLREDTVRANQNVETVLGYTVPADPYSFAGWMRHIHPGDRDRVAGRMKAFIGAKNALWAEEYRLVKADGSIIDILDRGQLVYHSTGTPLRMVGSMSNITERKMAEEAQRRFNEDLERTVQARTLELQRSNEDLERFAHVASHDLKEPVRKMRTTIDLLTIKYREQLGTDSMLLQRLAVSATRLSHMIESILAYSTVRYQPQGAESVDLNSVVRDVCDDLELIIAEKHAKVLIQSLPKMEGSRVLLHQLFYNLANNALKFSKAGVEPVLSIGAQYVAGGPGEMLEITLADNGIGFSPDEAEKIFGSFVRLHSKDRYEGTGLGLALCKRIVERHGGTIKAKGAPGEGAVFIVRFPTKQQDKMI